MSARGTEAAVRGRLLLAWAGVVALALLGGCATLPGLGGLAISVRRGTPFTIAQSTNIKWGVATHPTLARLGGGRLVCRYNTIGDIAAGRFGVAGAAGPSYSDDGGRTWRTGDPIGWREGPPPHVPVEFTVGQTCAVHYGYFWGAAEWPDGYRVMLHRDFARDFRTDVPPLGSFTNGLVSSADGRVWDGPAKVLITGFPSGPGSDRNDFYSNFALPPRAVVLPDGRMMASGYNCPLMGTKDQRFYKSFLLQSTNRGRSFEFVSIIATKTNIVRANRWGTLGPCEPTLARLPDGELLSIMRTGEIYENAFVSSGVCLEMLEARSRDDGRTWNVVQMDDVRGVMPCLTQMSNGVLALGYGRPGVRVLFSLDGGRTWPTKLDLVPYGRATSGYLDMMEVSPGRLLIVYDQVNKPASNIWLWEPPDKANIVYGVFVDVQPRKPALAGG